MMRRRLRRVFNSQSAIRDPQSRRGLAPLEFVLALPILVMLMALMIDFGVVGAWKIRTQTNARYAGWRSLTSRTGEFNATPPYWPSTANLAAQSGDPLPNVNQQWDSTQELLCPCVRGQQLTAPNATAAVNVQGRLEMDDNVIQGHAELERNLPLFRGALPATGGRFRFDINQDLFDNHWQFHTLGLSYNDFPRSRAWWDIEHTDLAGLDGAIDSHMQLLDQNLQLLQTNPKVADLYPLDNDDEHIRYRDSTPDYYPRLGSACEADPKRVYFDLVSRVDENGLPRSGSLLSRIDRLPCTMSGSFASMYRSWVCELEQCNAPDGDIDPLRQRYGDLQQFMGTLGSIGCSRPGNLSKCDPPMPPLPLPACPPSPVGVGR